MAPIAKDDITPGLAKLSIKTTDLETTELSQASKSKSTKKKKESSPVADSWEDEADALDSEDDGQATPVASTAAGTAAPPPTPLSPFVPAGGSNSSNKFHDEDNDQPGTSAPPPTPLSPVAPPRQQQQRQPPTYPPSGPGFTIPPFDGAGDWQSSSSSTAPDRRPEKTDAVARRMIAHALGVRAPRMTEEQRAYDRAMRENAKKRREEERERERKREEEAARLRQAMWDGD
ncbi:hypothetical protein VTJ83DRAFT_4808 [Remersonia thermophila]|uniref:Uncharacterized protein n=1 Tax=Remersonia thermophila TaxID=72144 RepID=A0ABR4DCG5_9PEZI